ncbi:hypothetical protein SDC9_139254 [bioreactor metagenome]|uniref:Uncharacterized protein n=1 Tax=bioreactor metagenome TaxID=1076179 RepID=A0A645DRL6_9ZZZZ
MDDTLIDLSELYAVLEVAQQFSKKKKIPFYFLESETGISVVSTLLSFETINEDVSNWFSDFEGTLLTVRCFDNDVLEISIFQNKKFITAHVVGDTYNYDIEKSVFNPKILTDIFNVSQVDYEKACSEDVEKTLKDFSELLKFPLMFNVADARKSKTSKITCEVKRIGI